MRTRKWVAINDKNQNFLIDEDGKVGFYLFVYENGNTRCTYDYLQDTLEMAKLQALEDFGVSESAWKQVE